VTVEEEERQRERERRRERGPAAAQIALLSASLIALIAAAAYFMRPPSADTMYGRIQSLAADEDPDRLLDAAADIDDFLERFPDDERAELLRKYQEEIALLRLERRFALRSRQLTRDPNLLPVERDYIEAMHQIGADPQRTEQELRALVTLYTGAGIQDERVLQVLELARRQLARLAQQARDQSPAYQAVIDRSLQRARALRDKDPEEARHIWRSIITLYEDKPWAAERVREAREELAGDNYEGKRTKDKTSRLQEE
jgi:hypothetical protein